MAEIFTENFNWVLQSMVDELFGNFFWIFKVSRIEFFWKNGDKGQGLEQEKKWKNDLET